MALVKYIKGLNVIRYYFYTITEQTITKVFLVMSIPKKVEESAI
jgi:hypothetical protein